MMAKKLIQTNNDTPFLLYGDENDQVHVKVLFQGETLWLAQTEIAELFETTKQNISLHLKNIFAEGELDEASTVKDFLTVQNESSRQVKRKLKFYNLDAIIAIGYRVNSKQATKFRIWVTQVLKEFIKKGFVLDDERLKQGEQTFGQDYFNELLERVRSIRASERRIYQKITDIFAEVSIDYDKGADITQDFYAKIQNKFHYAITGKTAAEIIHDKADRNTPYMGLSTWRNSPKGRVLASDVTIAKNYLGEKEIKRLERTVSGFFDYIENVIENRTTLTMQTMADSVDKFLNFNEYKVLEGKGKISKASADKKALEEYQPFIIDREFATEGKSTVNFCPSLLLDSNVASSFSRNIQKSSDLFLPAASGKLLFHLLEKFNKNQIEVDINPLSLYLFNANSYNT
jgi:hypothetical protein